MNAKRWIDWLVYGVYPLLCKRRSTRKEASLQRKKAAIFHAVQWHRRTMSPPLEPSHDVGSAQPSMVSSAVLLTKRLPRIGQWLRRHGLSFAEKNRAELKEKSTAKGSMLR